MNERSITERFLLVAPTTDCRFLAQVAWTRENRGASKHTRLFPDDGGWVDGVVTKVSTNAQLSRLKMIPNALFATGSRQNTVPPAELVRSGLDSSHTYSNPRQRDRTRRPRMKETVAWPCRADVIGDWQTYEYVR